MIKKTLLGIGLTFLSFIGFSHGVGVFTQVGLSSISSPTNSSYTITPLKGGAFLSNYLGVGKSVLALDNQRLFRRTTNGYPYVYLKGQNRTDEGFFDRYYSCDLMSGYNKPVNCSETLIDYTGDTSNFDKQIFTSFFKTVTQGQTVYIFDDNYLYVGASYDQLRNAVDICRNSEEIGKSFCFKGGYCYRSKGDRPLDCDFGNLVNSQNLKNQFNNGLTYGLLSNSWIGYAPGQNGYEGSRDNEENNTNTNTNNNYVCPTIRQIMQNMGENYNTGLCYNNTSYFNGTSFEQIDQEDIFTIFNDDYQNYINRISIYRNNCTNANTTQACQNAFSGEYKKYSIISNAINSNVDEKKLRNYCNLGLNYDPNATTCVASGGGIKEEYTTEEKINDIINNGVIPTPNTNQQTTGENQNNVFNALNKCENGDRECYVNNRNFIDSLKNIYGKITGLFKERNGVNGIIPNYILRITFLTILFTVIFKK